MYLERGILADEGAVFDQASSTLDSHAARYVAARREAAPGNREFHLVTAVNYERTGTEVLARHGVAAHHERRVFDRHGATRSPNHRL